MRMPNRSSHLQCISEGNNVDVVALFAHGLHTAPAELLHTQPLVAHPLQYSHVQPGASTAVSCSILLAKEHLLRSKPKCYAWLPHN